MKVRKSIRMRKSVLEKIDLIAKNEMRSRSSLLNFIISNFEEIEIEKVKEEKVLVSFQFENFEDKKLSSKNILGIVDNFLRSKEKGLKNGK